MSKNDDWTPYDDLVQAEREQQVLIHELTQVLQYALDSFAEYPADMWLQKRGETIRAELDKIRGLRLTP